MNSHVQKAIQNADMEYSENNSTVPNRPDFLSNNVVVVDGLIGGGKGLLSPIVGAMQRVEVWVHRGKIEQVCALQHLRHISMEGAVALIKSWTDEELYKLSVVRETNIRPKDMSSIFRDARPWRYFMRLFYNDGKEAIQRIRDSGSILNLMTHTTTGYAEPIFNALGNRLIYARITRSPLSEYMLNHLSRWSQRWGNDIDGMILQHNSNSNIGKNVPFFMRGKEDIYLQSPPMDRAILMLDEWQRRGDDVIDKMRKISSAKIIEVPFERFVIEPKPYIKDIADALGTKIDWITRRVMKKQGVPRVSLSDAPVSKAYIKLGWKAPRQHLSIHQEFEVAREAAKKTASSHAMTMLDSLADRYIKRYDIK